MRATAMLAALTVGWRGVAGCGKAPAGPPIKVGVLHSLTGQSCAAPEGMVTLDPATQHTSKMVRIGRIRSDGLTRETEPQPNGD